MTENYLRNITPDSLSGLVFGFEGIRNALVILNGPTGCKFYHSITAETQSVHQDDYDPLNYPDEWFFGQRRVPCTYLDKRDYVYGSDGKLTDAIEFMLGRLSPDILVVVNSPGAALIGDDLVRIVTKAVQNAGSGPSDAGSPIPVITCQSPGYSKDIIDGWRSACRIVVDKLCGQAEDTASADLKAGAANQDPAAAIDLTADTANQDPAADNKSERTSASAPAVNLLGLSIYQKYHAGDIAEIKRLFGLCGIRVSTALLCESSVEEIRKIPAASLNIVIDPDWGLDSAEYLKERFGMPYIVSEYGYPVGFKAMEKLLSDAASALNGITKSKSPGDIIDPEPALTELKKARAQVYLPIARMSSLTGLPKGAHFAVYGSPAVKRGYSAFLTDYLAMTEDPEDPEIVLADGNTIAMMKAEGKRISGIEISLPSIGYIDVIDKTHLGSSGGMFLIEQILNSFVY